MKEILRKGEKGKLRLRKCPMCHTEFTDTPDELMELRFFDEGGTEYRKVFTYCPVCNNGILLYEYLPVY